MTSERQVLISRAQYEGEAEAQKIKANADREAAETIANAEAEAKRCLAGLPPEQREVIVLKIWNEFTFEAIGRLLELSPNTVAGRYRYGMNKLKTLLKGKEYEPIRSHGENVAVMDPAQPLG